MKYEKLKSLFFPHTVVPLFLLIAIDYVRILGIFVQVFAAAYLMMQLLAFPAGFILCAFNQAKPFAVWKDVFKYRIVLFFPLFGGGKSCWEYLMSETDAKLTDE